MNRQGQRPQCLPLSKKFFWFYRRLSACRNLAKTVPTQCWDPDLASEPNLFQILQCRIEQPVFQLPILQTKKKVSLVKTLSLQNLMKTIPTRWSGSRPCPDVKSGQAVGTNLLQIRQYQKYQIE